MDDRARIDGLHAAALTCDAAGWITGVNARCVALFGAGPELLCGSSLATLFPNERDPGGRLRRSEGESIRLLGRRLTGVAFHVEAQAAAAPDGSLTLRLWDVLGAASAYGPASVSVARTP